MGLKYFNFIATADDERKSVKTFLRCECGLTARSMTILKNTAFGITVNGSTARTNNILHSGDIVRVTLPEEYNAIEPISGTLDILYEDDDLLILNKPSNMPVHPTKTHQRDTLANMVAYYQQQKGEKYIFRAMNRLDKDTTGCVVIAKDRITYHLTENTIHKTYVAICEGIIDKSGVINRPIALALGSKIKRCVDLHGSYSVTHYTPVCSAGRHTLLKIWLETGRTHQIRCHLSDCGHPLAGDDLYGGSTELIGRQALHCHSIELIHPVTKETVFIEAPIPADMSKIIREGL